MTVKIDGVEYFFEAKDPEEISRIWQIFQIVFYICTIVSSLSIIYCFSDVVFCMHFNCILNAELFLVEGNGVSVNHDNVSCVIDTARSKFHEKSCDIVMFMPVISTTIAGFFTSMFVICGRGGAGKAIPDAWRLVGPAIFFNLLSFCLMFYVAMVFQSGVHTFLESIKQVWAINKIDLSGINCLQVGNEQIGERLSIGLNRVRLTIWLSVSFLGLGVFWIILRFLFAIDFQLVPVSLITNAYLSSTNLVPERFAHNAKEVEENITNSAQESLTEVAQDKVVSSSQDNTPNIVTDSLSAVTQVEDNVDSISQDNTTLYSLDVVAEETESSSDDSFHTAQSDITIKSQQPDPKNQFCSFQ